MGWTFTDLARNRITLEQAQADHVRQATRYSAPIDAKIVYHEWHNKTWFAIMRMEGGRYTVPTYWLRIDMIDTSGGQFGYKDGAEEMGMYQDNKPSEQLKKLIYKYIPVPTGYGLEWRQRNGVQFKDPAQLELV